MPFTMPTLMPHQEAVVDWIVSHPKCGVFLTMGGGKSLCTLTALARVRPSGHILVVAPINIARSTWVAEVEKWGFPVRTKSLIVDENDKKLSTKQRLEAYDAVWASDPTMFFINVDLIDDLVKHMPVKKVNGRKEIQWPFPTVIIDESQTLKSPSGVRFKALAKVSPATFRFIELTGTPTPNGLMDLWSQVNLIDGGLALGPTVTSYRDRWFKPTRFVNDRPIRWEPLPGAAEEIYGRIKHKVMSAHNATIPKPPLNVEQVSVVLDKDTLTAYKDFTKQQVLDLVSPDPKQPGMVTITADNAAILYGKQLQFASGTMYTDEQKNFAVIHEHKLEMADYLIRNNGGSPVLVAYRYRSDQQQLMKHLGKLGHDVRTFDGSRGMIDRWNAGEVPVMLLQPASAGHGLNLQDGGHTLLWYTLPDSLEHYQQTIARLARIGQRNPVQVWELIARGTRDERMPDMLAAKAAVQDALLAAVAHDPVNAALRAAQFDQAQRAMDAFDRASVRDLLLTSFEPEDILDHLGDLDLLRV